MGLKTVLIATGVVNRRPEMKPEQHDDAVARGLLRYCPVCDGFEVTDKAVAVIGSGAKAFEEALFLRSYTRDVTLLSPHLADGLSPSEAKRLRAYGIRVEQGPITSLTFEHNVVRATTKKSVGEFASAYPALGSDVRSGLAARLGARLSDEGCINVDGHQRTTVSRLYAAGDVVIGLDQISHAMGQAGVAATAIRNDLSQTETLVR
jgi:thioredoxin reductase (NADPH)